MQTIIDVEKAISLNQELLSETTKRIRETSTKLSEAQGNVQRITADIAATKEKRQAALSRGVGDAKSLNDALKKSESELELESETVEGLQKFMAELQAEEKELHLKNNELPKQILRLESLRLAKIYNEKAAELAPVIEQLNEIYHKTAGNSNNKQDAVVFYPLEGVFEKLPRIFYDDAGLSLEQFVGKYPGRYHTNIMLAESEKCFYSWALHQNKLRS